MSDLKLPPRSGKIDWQGHGWVTPRADGVKARCGGPPMCRTCNLELERVEAEKAFATFKGNADVIRQEWIGKGRPIEAGWKICESLLLQGMPENQLRGLRRIYFLGAHHTYHCLQAIVTQDIEPTEQQINLVQTIAAELIEWSAGQDFTQPIQDKPS
jgi:hypothetical protein